MADRSRLRRLLRLETIRAIARHEAARAAAEAEGTLAQLNALADRTLRMADDYRDRRGEVDGLALHQFHRFVSGLAGIARSTTNDAMQARAIADQCQAELAQAERRRAMVEDRAKAEARALARKREVPSVDGRRQLGTALE